MSKKITLKEYDGTHHVITGVENFSFGEFGDTKYLFIKSTNGDEYYFDIGNIKYGSVVEESLQ